MVNGRAVLSYYYGLFWGIVLTKRFDEPPRIFISQVDCSGFKRLEG